MSFAGLKLTLRFKTPVVTPLQSDTFFGEFCWHYKFLYGEEKLQKLLQNCPAVVFSDGFPEGFLPLPKLPMINSPFSDKFSGRENKLRYQSFKKFKKVKFIKKETLDSLADSLSADLLWEEFQKSPENFSQGVGKSSISLHVSINRLTGTHREGALFEYRETVLPENIDLYAVYDETRLTEKELIETMAFLGLNGFGAKKTSGKGKFEIVSVTKEKVPLGLENSKTFISLSTGLPQEAEISDYYAEFFTKYPKHGIEFGSKAVFKTPLILSRPGSTFVAKQQKQVYGSLVRASVNEKHLHSRAVIPYFVRLENAGL